MERIEGLEPFIPDECRVLILGSMPSVKSLEKSFYYANPQNRMFKLLNIYYEAKQQGHSIEVGSPVADPKKVLSTTECQEVLHTLKIGMYDVVKSCVREGSLDSAIKDVEYADILGLLQKHPTVSAVITAGGFASKELKKSTLKHLSMLDKTAFLQDNKQYALGTALSHDKCAALCALDNANLYAIPNSNRVLFHISLPSTSPANTIKLEKLKLNYDLALLPLLF